MNRSPDPLRAADRSTAPRERSWLEIRWRQFRNAPPPVTRAVAASVGVALSLAVPLLAYDLAVRRSGPSPGGDLRTAAIVLYVLAVLVAGSVLTYLWVPLPTGASGIRRRTPWSAALGIFAAIPVAYLVLVLVFQVVEPLLGP
jgi:hypothetical protein